MRKLAVLLLVFLLLICVSALAEETLEVLPAVFTCGDYEYILPEDGTAEIKRYYGNDEVITIPDTLDAYQVKRIGDNAFYNCSSLMSVTLPDSITSIGDWAFFGCSSLKSVTLPDSLIEIGVNPFAYCSVLEEIIVSPDHPVFELTDGVLFNKQEKKLVSYACGSNRDSYSVPQGILAVENGAFSYCSSLTSVTFSDSVTSIGDFAFEYCYSLSSVTFSDSITSMGDSAFSSCFSLTSVTLPDGITNIGCGVFDGCTSLTSVTLPDGITSIGDDAFSYCFSLTSVTLPDSIRSIGDFAFVCCDSLTSVTLPDGLIEIGVNPFAYCSVLEEIIVSPDHPVFEVTDGVLFNKQEKKLVCCPCGLNKDSYSVPKGTLAVGDYAFYFCDSLTSVTLPDGITSIGDWAFTFCDSLTSVTLPDSVTSIDDYAFYDCSSLTSVTLPAAIQDLDLDYVFKNCENITFTVPRDSDTARLCKEAGVKYTYPDADD